MSSASKFHYRNNETMSHQNTRYINSIRFEAIKFMEDKRNFQSGKNGYQVHLSSGIFFFINHFVQKMGNTEFGKSEKNHCQNILLIDIPPRKGLN